MGYHTEKQCEIKLAALFNEIKDLKELMNNTQSLTMLKYHVDSLYQLTKELEQEMSYSA